MSWTWCLECRPIAGWDFSVNSAHSLSNYVWEQDAAERNSANFPLHPFNCDDFNSFFACFFLRTAPVACGGSQANQVELELQLPAKATATAMPDLSFICDLQCSLRQCLIPNSLSKARESSQALCWVHNPLSHDRNSKN